MVKILLDFFRGEIVFSKIGTWELTRNGTEFTEWSTYEIRYIKFLNKYYLKIGGYKPKNHNVYPVMIQIIHCLNNGNTIIYKGTLMDVNINNLDEENVKNLSLTQCNNLLKEAVEQEKFDLALLLQKQKEKIEKK